MKAYYLNTINGQFIVIEQENSVMTIPYDMTNSDYVNIMKLVEEGKLIIQPADNEEK